MLAELTPEQQYELCAYHGIEPFGEVRMDFRFAQLQQLYVASHSKKGKKVPPLEAFTMYADIYEAAEERQGTADLQSHLAALGAQRSTDGDG
jgi:hypothetical protein